MTVDVGIPGTDSVDLQDHTSDDGAGTKDATETDQKQKMARFFKTVLHSTDKEIIACFDERAEEVASRFPALLEKYCIVTLFASHGGIDNVELDGVFARLREDNPTRGRDVLLVLLSHGGAIEPAYQISKVCKQMAANSFVTVIPRYAKSAATLIAIGSDEIHIGPLGHLGPIDPQLQILPALGVAKALESIASVCEKYPKSAPMFAQFLRGSLTVREIGYCDRIAESAVQYAERLLSTKPSIEPRVARNIARKLVHEFKHHGFVIDISEARGLLGDGWIKSGTEELEFAEKLYTLYEEFGVLLRRREKQLILVGDWKDRMIVLDLPND